ncbi:MAG: hypothetical protein AB7E76_03695 [Deferribacterales bacterium]
MKFFLILLVLISISSTALASGESYYHGPIKRVYTHMNGPYAGIVLIKTDESYAITDSSECATNVSFQYAFDAKTPAGAVTLTIVMTSFIAKLNITLYGTTQKTCDNFPGIEDLEIVAPYAY